MAWGEWGEKVTLLAIGQEQLPPTLSVLRKLGYKEEPPTAAGMINAVLEHTSPSGFEQLRGNLNITIPEAASIVRVALGNAY